MNSLEILQFDMPTLIHHILISNNGVQNDVQGGEEIWEKTNRIRNQNQRLGLLLCARKVRKKELILGEAREALELLDFLNIKLIFDFALVKRSLELAVELEQMSIYDTMYLAAAEQENCQLWTADQRFASIASKRYPFVRSL
jgi:predicted nucleic acid-binding protein